MSTAINGPVFHRVDVEAKSFVFKGPFGTDYSISISTDGFSVDHGQFLRHKYSGRVCFVIGTLQSSLWVQYADEGHAVIIKPAELADCVVATIDGQEAQGPFLRSYVFSTRNVEADFEVKPREHYHLRLLGENVVIVGSLLGILWVRKESQPNFASPLPKCTNPDTLRSLYGLCDIAPGSNMPQPSPRIGTTPRQPAFKLSDDRSKAACNGPLGAKFDADATPAALKPFGVTHGQRLVGVTGLVVNKFASVVGVRFGNLVVHVENEGKVTELRNCKNSADLANMFSTGSKQASIAQKERSLDKPVERNLAASPPKIDHAPKNNATPVIAPLKLPTTNPGPGSPAGKASPSRAGGFLCWTAFGRYSFDTAGARKFGLKHGKSVRCTKGAESGKLFHVVGECHGNLWVIPDGKQRAIPLLYCDNAQDIAERYGFMDAGSSDLSRFQKEVDEPAASPISSPRVVASAVTPRLHKIDVTGELVFSPNQATRSVTFSPPQQQRAEPSEQEPAKGTSPHCPPTRLYLKAVALVNLGFPSSGAAPMAFHEFYMTSTIPRLHGALKRLPHAKGLWEAEKVSAFEDATVDEMVAVFGQHRDAFFL